LKESLRWINRFLSRNSRQLTDLPREGIPLRVELRLRRFFAPPGKVADTSSRSGCRTR
jgi:hypothetical protein